MKRLLTWLLAGLLLGANGFAANVKNTVYQVSTPVTISNDVDYMVTSMTPFIDEGVVDIANTEHALLILTNVKPSKAIPLLANHVRINGEVAVNNRNCQVKLYNRGCIIMPYANTIKPLTVYSEKNFEGRSSNSFGLGNTGGYMNTMTDAQLNNKVRSFKLKRGYMVTFSLRAGGRGYSRCFIAANSDLEVPELPAVMDQKISSYRVFKWYDAGKKQLANDLNTTTLDILNVNSSYTWSEGHDIGPDFECVPNHIYEDYPSSAAIGSATWSPHSKNNNEPLNKSDDRPQDLNTILNNWENMMRTGMRLCSPASWDGSDYWNATGFLAEFMDSIDARGWRCDIIDLHCYWTEGSFGNIANWVNKYHRPVWISEWCWGASWNNNGAFASGVTQEQVKTALQNICGKLNGWDYVERYYYWNGEAEISRLYTGGKLTPAGEYYAAMNSGMAYNGKYDFVPTTPKQYGPSNYTAEVVDGVLRLKWHDANGEFNQLMEIQKKNATGKWVTLQVIDQKEEAADYTYDITEDIDGTYRLHLKDLAGKDYYTSDDLAVGDQIDIDGKTYYVGGNLIVNGDFNMGFSGWTNGAGTALAAPHFEIIGKGGADDGAYLQSYSNGDGKTEASAKQVIDLQANTDYYFRAAVCNTNTNPRFCLSTDGTTESKVVIQMKASTIWSRVGTSFNTGTYTKGLVAFRNLMSKSQFDKVELRQLFEKREDAIADGIVVTKAEALALADYFTAYPALSAELRAVANSVTGTDEQAFATLNEAVTQFLKAIDSMSAAQALMQTLSGFSQTKWYQYDEMMLLAEQIQKAESAATVLASLEELQALADAYLAFQKGTAQPKSPSFASAAGWETIVGTYKGGDQRLNTLEGTTCWNAWWAISAKDNPTATMEIRQKVTGLPMGYYALQCKATTQHYCITDQHGYMTYGDETFDTPVLTYDYADLPVGDIWETLTTKPVFIGEGGQVTIGFTGSKNGAVDGLWHRYGSSTAGDNREGWWCATDFTLLYMPFYQREVVANEWNVICLPYASHLPKDMRLYEIAGINPDYTQLCLQQVEEAEAGVPYIFKSESAQANFYEYGDAVVRPAEGTGNMRGFFKVSTAAPVNYFFLQGSKWIKITSDMAERPKMSSYTALIRPFNATGSKHIPVIDSWEGETMPIEGVTEEDKATNVALGIYDVKTTSLPAGYYTISGKTLQGEPVQKGVVIKVENGEVRKMVVR